MRSSSPASLRGGMEGTTELSRGITRHRQWSAKGKSTAHVNLLSFGLWASYPHNLEKKKKTKKRLRIKHDFIQLIHVKSARVHDHSSVDNFSCITWCTHQSFVLLWSQIVRVHEKVLTWLYFRMTHTGFWCSSPPTVSDSCHRGGETLNLVAQRQWERWSSLTFCPHDTFPGKK